MIRPSWCLHDPPRVMERGTKRNQPWVPTMVYKMILWNLLVSACMHVGECDVREIRKAIKAALTFTIFSISLSNLRYICILMLLTIWYCQSSMKVDACTLHCNLALIGWNNIGYNFEGFGRIIHNLCVWVAMIRCLDYW